MIRFRKTVTSVVCAADWGKMRSTIILTKLRHFTNWVISVKCGYSRTNLILIYIKLNYVCVKFVSHRTRGNNNYSSLSVLMNPLTYNKISNFMLRQFKNWYTLTFIIVNNKWKCLNLVKMIVERILPQSAAQTTEVTKKTQFYRA
jgi:hypothetical protein